MPFHFRSRRQEAAARRNQYVLAFTALALVVAILVCWLIIRYYQSGISDKPAEENSVSSLPVEDPAQTAATLLILNQSEAERFVLVQFNPADKKAYTIPLPAQLDGGQGATLAEILRKHGSPQAKETAAQVLGLPITHHLTLSVEDVETYLNYLEGGVTYTLPEAATYINDSLVEATIPAGEHHLTANQVGGLLRHDGWSNQTADRVAAELIAAILNQYMVPEHRFGGDFAALANLAQTDIRIDHYNAYSSTLEQLANSNTAGTLCQAIAIPGKYTKDRFSLDREALHHTPLYDETQP